MPSDPGTPSSKLSIRTKFAYGVGQIAEGVKTRGFDTLVFFYFTQVLGLSGTRAGLALFIALMIDAVSDPLVGVISDGWRSKHGRRHPFMYASAIPLGVSWYLLFVPPAGISQNALFLWLITFAVLVRQSMTLYHIPHLALGAELSEDYHERTSVVGWRTSCAVIGAVGFILLGIRLFLPETPQFENGMMNPAGYPKIALASAFLMVVTIWYSAWGTRDRIPYLPQPAGVAQSYGEYLKDLGVAFRNPSFLALFCGFALFTISSGVREALSTHVNAFFWQFDSRQIANLGVTFVLGFFPGVALARPLHRRFDKKWTMIVASSAAAVFINIGVILRLFGLFPENDSPLLFPTIFMLLLGLAVTAGVALTTAGSMMADVAQEHQFQTGKTQQGVLFSAISFANKMTSGVGHFVAGIGIDLIGFPLQASPSAVSATLIRNLGLLNLISSLIGVIGLGAYFFYRLDKNRYHETRALMEGRSSAEPVASASAENHVRGVA